MAGLATVPVIASLHGLADLGGGGAGLGQPAAAAAATEKITRGAVRRFNAPWLTPGARLKLPSGIQAVAVEGWFENRTRVAPKPLAWPHLPAADGTRVDASVVPKPGAPSLMAVLTGFDRGRYELVHANGKVDRVKWDAERFPYLWYWAEWGAAKHFPFMGSFYHLSLQPLSHNPVS
ncbi:hypothetical protein [Baekduia alba]|uniref:hypothetical protein n=1 Tax=Baekduia alba TaxID=2997333 RepID=UPI002341D75C|nr:hypothetical protein [Baekduia alba]